MLRYILSFALVTIAFTAWTQTFSLGGQVTTDADDTVGDVSLEIVDADGNVQATAITDCSGTYLFTDLEGGTTYTLRAEKGGNYLNGNSAFDLIIVSRHLLGIQELSSAYRIVAADVDESGSISVLDLLFMRALILAIQEEYAGQNWLFFRPGDTAANSGFDFVLSADMTDFDLISIKKGDVNNSAIPCE